MTEFSLLPSFDVESSQIQLEPSYKQSNPNNSDKYKESEFK